MTPTESLGPDTGPGPGRPACPGRSAASGWLMPVSARRPGPSWFARPRGWRARAFRSRPTWPAHSIGNSRRTIPKDATGRRREDFGRLADFPESVAAFAKPDRTPWKAGDRLVQRDLAATLDRIAETAPTSSTPAGQPRSSPTYMAEHGGFVTRDDLKSYQAKLRSPVHTTFRGFDVYSIGPSSSGGIVLCQMLNILERYDLKADGRESPRTLHRVTEAMRRAFYTRATNWPTPTSSRSRLKSSRRRPMPTSSPRSIGEKATPSQELAPFTILSAEGDHTTHLSSIDQAGNAVALTYTLEESYGAKCVVAGAGFLLNNEMGDFNLIPGRTDTTGRIGTPPNLIAPHKRMLSSQTPTLLLKEGRVRVVTGSPGGRTIPNTVFWVVLNLVEFGLEPRQAVDAPRTHHQWFPDVLVLEGRSWPEATRQVAHVHGAQARDERAPGQREHDRRRSRRQAAGHRRSTALDGGGRG